MKSPGARTRGKQAAAAITPRIDFGKELAGMFDLEGRVALLPGGYGGIGEAIAWALARHGATVLIAGRSSTKAAALARTLRAAGHRAQGTAIDAVDLRDIERAVDALAARHGTIDILVNCVGPDRAADRQRDRRSIRPGVRSNLKAAMFLAQAVARHQIAAGRGGKQIHLLSVRSQLGLRARGYSAYCSTKGALVMLIKQHAMELAPHRINVNGIAPTFVYTEMIRHVMENPSFRQQLLERIPLGRIADPKDIAGPALFFASPASDFVTGQTLYVDGGITASQ